MFNLAEPYSMTEQKFEQRHRFMVSDDYTVGKVASDMSPIDCQSGMSGKCLPVNVTCTKEQARFYQWNLYIAALYD